MKKENLLTLLILAGLVGGVIFGQLVLFDASATAEKAAQAAAPWNDIGIFAFLRPLQMLIVPLVFVSVVSGVTSIGNPKQLGLVGGSTLAYYVGTTLLAVLLGLLIVNIIRPGEGVSAEQLRLQDVQITETYEKDVAGKIAGRPDDVGSSFRNLLESLVPSNPIEAFVEPDILSVVVFAGVIGLALVCVGDPGKPVIRGVDGMFQAMIKLVTWVIWLAPLGVFCLVAARVGELGLESIVGPLGKYMLTVVIALSVHVLVVLPIVLAVLGGTNPYKFLWNLRKVILTAFSTASSNATLPVTIEECTRVGGCSKRATAFVIPLGSTVNMNGTALYEAVAVTFLFQLFAAENPQFDLPLSQQLVILVTATLAAIGAAGIPAAGLVTMTIVITSVNGSLQAIHGPEAAQLPLAAIGVIVGVDRLLDMCRTTVNVMGDAFGARIITRLAPDEPEFEGA